MTIAKFAINSKLFVNYHIMHSIMSKGKYLIIFALSGAQYIDGVTIVLKYFMLF